MEKLNVFECQELAENELRKKYAGTCIVSSGYSYIAVSANLKRAMICPDYQTALSTNLDYVFKARYNGSGITSEICEYR